MAEKNQVRKIVEQAVSQVLEGYVPRLREELIERVVEEVRAQIKAPADAGGAGAADLLRAISGIHAGGNQKEILRALLEGTSDYCGRTALFVVKGSAANGWQGRGFAEGSEIKDFGLDTGQGLPARALQSRRPEAGTAAEMDGRFIASFGTPADSRVLVLPLVLKDKVAALVYADAGTESGGRMHGDALELLVAATSAWLEVASLRKQASKDGPSDATAAEKAEAAPVAKAAAAAFSDPFAGHAPLHTMSAVPEPVAETAVAAAAEAAPAAVATAAAAPAPAADPFAHLSPADADVHRKAQRFARLLMDEIKLYNQAKVSEGRKNKDLYDRLKEDIDKSRATYEKRYGNTVASAGNYFHAELVRILADDDASLMGTNFRR